MDCNIVKGKLLDYMDGNLDSEEVKAIEEHLKTCSECSNEYAEIKSTIDYVIDNFSKIDTGKELNLNPNIMKKKSTGLFTRMGLIAAILSLMLAVTVFATDIFDFIKWWKRSSERQISAWENLIENGVGEKLNISVTDKDIRVTAEGIIADDLNTIILLKIEDLKGNIRFTPYGGDNSNPCSISVSGDIRKRFEDIPPLVNYSPLYAEDENTVKLMVYTEPLDKDEGMVEIHLNKLMSLINENEESIIEVSGNWDMTIPAKKIPSKVYFVDEEIDLNGNELVIEKVTIAPTTTRIHYKFNVYNAETGRYIENVTFLIKAGGKTYARSELSRGGSMAYRSYGFVNREFDIQSLYLEDPSDIEIIVNTCTYTMGGLEKYNIDWDNLPQVIKYQNSRITIEGIKYSEDSTEIMVKEDRSWNRKYIKTYLYLRIDETTYIKDGEEDVPIKRDYYFSGTPLEYEIRDSKGKVKDLESKLWSDEYHYFVFRQNITLSKEQFERMDMNKDHFDEYLIPGELYIEGQEYIEYPYIKRNIKLQR